MLPRIVTPRQLNTLRWYARRPRLWKQFFRVVREKRSTVTEDVRRTEAEKTAATEWAERSAISEAEALARITGSDTVLRLSTECAGDVAAGQARQRSCPVKMGSGADYDLLYTLAERIGCVSAVETGVAFGWSSFALLHSLAKRGGRLISTDMPYPLRENDAFVGCVVPERLRNRWTLLRAADRDALPTALKRLSPIDLCHYDSDKSKAGRQWAYPRLWNALRPGGIFLTDDVQDNLGYAEFCASVGLPPLVVRVPERQGFKYGGILVKP
jgi:predicted O-methyltransferase YrrM